MTKNEEVFLGLSYWVASLDGNFDISEKEFIEKSDSFKSFYTADNFEYCKKNVIESSKNKDTKQFISEYLDGLNLSKEESKKLVIDLCEIGASDGDFDDIEKKYIGFVIEALGLENEKIIESFEKPKKNKNLLKDTSINSLDVPRSLLFAKKEEELIPVIKQKIQNHIEKKLSIKGFDLTISDLKINKTKKLSTRVLYDNREIEEDLEINYSGAIESRTVSKSGINLFESNCSGNPPIRQDYEFKNLSKVKKFRVDGTNERVTCSKCSGLRKVTCYGCSGAGKNRCSGCNGRGDNDCSNCTGGERHCYSCGGDGRTSSYDYDLQRDVSKTCSSCAGRGRNPCGTCGRTGRVRCSTCSGTGQVTCYTCSGRGEIPCSRCDAQGSFTYFLRISSKLLKKENSSFIDGEPDKQYITKNLGTEEFEYSKLFGKYELSKLKEHAPELKNLFKVIKFDSAQKPKKIRFDLEDCASMSFVVTVAGNVYVGGLNNEGKLYFDETILDQLFFNIIKTLDVDNSFKSIESIKSPVLAQIPNFNETYEKIGEYKTLRKIVESTQKNEVKLNKVRKLKNVDTSIYSKFLIGKIINKYRFISILAALISHLPLWFFYPLISTVIAVLLIVVFFSIKLFCKSICQKHKKRHLKFT
jgi:tellurite resistance protein